MTFKLSDNSKKNRAGVDQRLIEIDDLAITLTLVDYGHGPYSGFRETSTQFMLYSENKSQKDGVVKRSKHQDGKAIDFYAWVDGKLSYEHEHLAMIACAYFQAASLLGHKIRWGGLWKSKTPTIKNEIPYGWDCPHIELVD